MEAIKHSTKVKFLLYLLVLFALIGVIFDLVWLSNYRKTQLTPEVYISNLRARHRARLAELNQANRRSCEPPSPDAFNQDVLPYLYDATTIEVRCTRKTNKNGSNVLLDGVVFEVKNGRFLHKIQQVGVPCCYKEMKRKEDNDEVNLISRDCHLITENVTELSLDMEYITVECGLDNFTVHEDVFALVHKKPRKTRKNRKSQKLNVIVIGMESTSQLNFFRKMPLTSDYLLMNLSGVLLQGLNMVAENTHSNVIPLLTGQSLGDFENACVDPQLKKNRTATARLNECKLIWNSFAERGYLTAFAEDSVIWSFFNLYWRNCFKKPPTDYYFRPVGLRSYELKEMYDTDYCLGPRYSLKALLNYVETIAEVNQDKPIFQFIWPGKVGYMEMNELELGDAPLLATLKRLQSTNVLNKTALFLIGDHGARNTEFASTPTGEIEERMPIGVILLPEWFPKSYPMHYSNLIGNAQKMTSLFDVHKTMLDILNLDEEQNYPGPGSSLFKPISDSRSCLSAGIPLFWCIPCHPRIPLDNNSSLALEAAEFFVQTVGEQLYPLEGKDVIKTNLSLKAILNASVWDPRDVQSELCSPIRGNQVLLPGFLGESLITLNIPCSSFSREDVIVKVKFEINSLNGTFTGEVIKLSQENGGIWHLTEMIFADSVIFSKVFSDFKGRIKRASYQYQSLKVANLTSWIAWKK